MSFLSIIIIDKSSKVRNIHFSFANDKSFPDEKLNVWLVSFEEPYYAAPLGSVKGKLFYGCIIIQLSHPYIIESTQLLLGDSVQSTNRILLCCSYIETPLYGKGKLPIDFDKCHFWKILTFTF